MGARRRKVQTFLPFLGDLQVLQTVLDARAYVT
jgi:hypothetical protein